MLQQNLKSMIENAAGNTSKSVTASKFDMAMSDLDRARTALDGHTIVLCRNSELTISDKRGISAMMDWISEGRDMRGSSVADVIVGKAVAMLFIISGIAAVHARTLSRAGLNILRNHGIEPTYETLTENIQNREGTDICPMEKTVLNINDPSYGYAALLKTLNALRQTNASENISQTTKK